jgi:hypothetical protein
MGSKFPLLNTILDNFKNIMLQTRENLIDKIGGDCDQETAVCHSMQLYQPTSQLTISIVMNASHIIGSV